MADPAWGLNPTTPTQTMQNPRPPPADSGSATNLNIHISQYYFFAIYEFTKGKCISNVSFTMISVGGVWIQGYRGWDRKREMDERLGLNET